MSDSYKLGFKKGLELVIAGNSLNLEKKLAVGEELPENLFGKGIKHGLGFIAAPFSYTLAGWSTVAVVAYALQKSETARNAIYLMENMLK